MIKGTLLVTGTAGNDSINITQRGSTFIVRQNASIFRFGKSDHIRRIAVGGLAGDDRIKIVSTLSATVDGSEGDDIIRGGAGNDLLMGGNGDDRLLGNGGNDTISGNPGRDSLFGGAGDDDLDSFDNQPDNLSGGAGHDRARIDPMLDTAWKIEGTLSNQPTGAASTPSLSPSGSGNLNLDDEVTLVTFIDLATNFSSNSSISVSPISDADRATLEAFAASLN